MRRAYFATAMVVALCAFATAQRLPELAVPTNYQLTLTPDFSTDKFAGNETILI